MYTVQWPGVLLEESKKEFMVFSKHTSTYLQDRPSFLARITANL
jgi:hypothetical protein